MKNVLVYFILFIIYSITGWTIEVVRQFIKKKRFINRGFFIGPYCPIYGYGALLITFLLSKYKHEWFVLFVMAILICRSLRVLYKLHYGKIV